MLKGDDLTTFIMPKVMKNPEALTFRIPNGLFRPVAGKLYLYLYYLTVEYKNSSFFRNVGRFLPKSMSSHLRRR
jgi:hypothetical protein